jgi:hypothetical protein
MEAPVPAVAVAPPAGLPATLAGQPAGQEVR